MEEAIEIDQQAEEVFVGKLREVFRTNNNRKRMIFSIGSQSLGKSFALNTIFNTAFSSKKGAIHIAQTNGLEFDNSDLNYFIIDMEGVDGVRTSPKRDILNFTTALAFGSVVIVHIEHRAMGDGAFISNFAYKLWQALRNLKSNNQELKAKIVIFLRNPGDIEELEKYNNFFKQLILDFESAINIEIQKLKNQFIEMTRSYCQQDNPLVFETFIMKEQIENIKISKHYTLLFESNRVSRQKKYIRVKKIEENFEFVEWDYKEIKTEIFTLADSVDRNLNINDLMNNNALITFYPEVNEELANATLTEKQFIVICQQVTLNPYSSYRNIDEYNGLFKCLVCCEERNRSIFEKIIEECKKDISEDKITKLRQSHKEKFAILFKEVKVLPNDIRIITRYFAYNSSLLFENEICLSANKTDNPAYKILHTILNFGEERNIRHQINQMKRSLNKYKCLSYFPELKAFIIERLPGNMNILYLICEIYNERIQESLNKQFTFKDDLYTHIDRILKEDLSAGLIEFLDLLSEFYQFNHDQIFSFVRTLKNDHFMLLYSRFNNLPEMPKEVKMKEIIINESIYSFTILERLIPCALIIASGIGTAILRSISTSAAEAALIAVCTTAASAFLIPIAIAAGIIFGVNGLISATRSIASDKKTFKVRAKFSVPDKDYFIYADPQIDMNKRNGTFKVITNRVSQDKRSYEYEGVLEHDITTYDSAFVKIEIKIFYKHLMFDLKEYIQSVHNQINNDPGNSNLRERLDIICAQIARIHQA